MQKNFAVVAALLFSILFVQSCATTHGVIGQSPAERSRKGVEAGEFFSKKFETQFQIKHDPEVASYLRSILDEMVRFSPGLKEATPTLFLIGDVKKKWKSYTFAGARVYLSAGWLRATHFESEAVSMLALEVAHLMRRQAFQNASTRMAKTSTNGAGVEAIELRDSDFDYTEEQWSQSIDDAIAIVYQLNFDPRGMGSLLHILEEHPAESPIATNIIASLIDRANRAVTQYPPLRNPIISSEEYFRIKKRIERL